MRWDDVAVLVGSATLGAVLGAWLCEQMVDAVKRAIYRRRVRALRRGCLPGERILRVLREQSPECDNRGRR